MKYFKVKRIESPESISTILLLNDPGLEISILSGSECTKAEWVQFLLDSCTKNDHIRVYGVMDDEKVLGYMVAVNSFMPPISRSFIILYQTFLGIDTDKRVEVAMQCLDLVKEWALSVGSHVITINTGSKSLAKLYSMHAGFKETDEITLKLEF